MRKELTLALQSWRTLNTALRTVDEEQCHVLLNREKAGKARLQFLNRIHGAYNRRRFARERMELTKAARKP